MKNIIIDNLIEAIKDGIQLVETNCIDKDKDVVLEHISILYF